MSEDYSNYNNDISDNSKPSTSDKIKNIVTNNKKVVGIAVLLIIAVVAVSLAGFGSEDPADPVVNIEEINEDTKSATFEASLSNIGSNDEVIFEYRQVGAGEWETTQVSTDAGDNSVTDTIDGLDSSTEYEGRLVAVRDTSRTESDINTFETRIPEIINSSNLSFNDPESTPTTIEFSGEQQSSPNETIELTVRYREEGTDVWSQSTALIESEGPFNTTADELSEDTTYEYQYVAEIPTGRRETEIQEISTGLEKSVEENGYSTEWNSAEVSASTTGLGISNTANGYFEYRREDNTSWTKTEPQSISNGDEFTAEITDLEPNTNYEFRAVGEYENETYTSDVNGFTTNERPEIEFAVSSENLLWDEITAQVDLSNLGIYSAVEVTAQYRESDSDEWTNLERTEQLNRPETVDFTIIETEPETQYEFRGTVSAGGETKNETTEFTTPELTVADIRSEIINTTYNSVQIENEIVNIQDGVEQIDLQVEYRSINGTEWTEVVNDTYSESTLFESNITGLESNKDYEKRLSVSYNNESAQITKNFTTRREPSVELFTGETSNTWFNRTTVNYTINDIVRYESAEAVIEYKKSNADSWNQTEPVTIDGDTNDFNGNVDITGLDGETVYEYRVKVNTSGNTEYTGDSNNFETTIPPDIEISSNTVNREQVSETSFNVSGEVDFVVVAEQAEVYGEYKTESGDWVRTEESINVSTENPQFTFEFTDLNPGTTYDYRLIGETIGDVKVRTDAQSEETFALNITTLESIDVTETSATLRGEITEYNRYNYTYIWFQYKPSEGDVGWDEANYVYPENNPQKEFTQDTVMFAELRQTDPEVTARGDYDVRLVAQKSKDGETTTEVVSSKRVVGFNRPQLELKTVENDVYNETRDVTLQLRAENLGNTSGQQAIDMTVYEAGNETPYTNVTRSTTPLQIDQEEVVEFTFPTELGDRGNYTAEFSSPYGSAEKSFEINILSSDCSFTYNESSRAAGYYEVSDLNELQCIDQEEQLDRNFILTQDINASDSDNWNAGNGLKPIGSAEQPFKGRFEGNGYTINNLTINRSSAENVGLFGYTNETAEIGRFSMNNSNITGEENVGNLVGYNNGYINKTRATIESDVNGEISVGGLIGHNEGTIEESYTLSEITKANNIIEHNGAVIGENNGTLNDVYWDITSVIVDQEKFDNNNQGDLDGIGDRDGSLREEENVFGLNKNQMTGQDPLNAMPRFDFDTTWILISSLDESTTAGYPQLQKATFYDSNLTVKVEDKNDRPVALAQTKISNTEKDSIRVARTNFDGQAIVSTEKDETYGVVIEVAGASETVEKRKNVTIESSEENVSFQLDINAFENEPKPNTPDCSDVTYQEFNGNYVVTDDYEFQCMGINDHDGTYELARNINISQSDQWNGGFGYYPIGTSLLSGQVFNGTVNGNGFDVSGVYINYTEGPEDVSKYGLFQDIGSEGEINDLTVRNISFRGDTEKDEISALAADNSGIISNVKIIDSQIGRNSGSTFGGIAGESSGTVENSYINGLDVTTFANQTSTSGDSAGGAVGNNLGTIKGISIQNTTITTNHNTVGGIVGINQGDLRRSKIESTTVTGAERLGGAVGQNTENVKNVYAETTVKNTLNTDIFDMGGLIGLHQNGNISNSVVRPTIIGKPTISLENAGTVETTLDFLEGTNTAIGQILSSGTTNNIVVQRTDEKSAILFDREFDALDGTGDEMYNTTTQIDDERVTKSNTEPLNIEDDRTWSDYGMRITEKSDYASREMQYYSEFRGQGGIDLGEYWRIAPDNRLELLNGQNYTNGKEQVQVEVQLVNKVDENTTNELNGLKYHDLTVSFENQQTNNIGYQQTDMNGNIQFKALENTEYNISVPFQDNNTIINTSSQRSIELDINPDDIESTPHPTSPEECELLEEQVNENIVYITDDHDFQCIGNGSYANNNISESRLIRDINANLTSRWNGKNGFRPVSISGNPNHTIDGQKHTVKGLAVRSDHGLEKGAIFNKVRGTLIQNMSLDNIYIRTDVDSAPFGSIGQVKYYVDKQQKYQASKIANVTISGDIITSEGASGVVYNTTKGNVQSKFKHISSTVNIRSVVDNQQPVAGFGADISNANVTDSYYKGVLANNVNGDGTSGFVSDTDPNSAFEDIIVDAEYPRITNNTNPETYLFGDINESADANNVYVNDSLNTELTDINLTEAEMDVNRLNKSDITGEGAVNYMDGIGSGNWTDVDNEIPDITVTNTREKSLRLRMNGSGTSADPYEITNVEQLEYMNVELDAHYELVNDINAIQTADMNSFNPIGYDDSYREEVGSISDCADTFCGTFDFNGHTISNISIQNHNSESSDLGLFRRLNANSQISNPEPISNVTIIAGGANNVGAFAGSSDNKTISNIQIENARIKGTYSIGGVVGNTDNNTIENTIFTGKVMGNSNVGGITGYSDNTSYNNNTIVDDTGLVTGLREVGGIVGHGEDIDMDGSTTNIDVTGNTIVGGIVGRADDSNIANARSMSDVAGVSTVLNFSDRNPESVGGIIGRINDSHLEQSQSYGNITGDRDSGKIGGVSGFIKADTTLRKVRTNSSEVRSMNPNTSNPRVDIIGQSNVGGLIGDTNDTLGGITIENSVADGDLAGQNKVSGFAITSDPEITITNSYTNATVIEGEEPFLAGSIDTSTDNYWVSRGTDDELSSEPDAQEVTRSDLLAADDIFNDPGTFTGFDSSQWSDTLNGNDLNYPLIN